MEPPVRDVDTPSHVADLTRFVVWVFIALFAAGAVDAFAADLWYTRPDVTGSLSLLLAAQSGWGKSFKAQHVIEKNLPEYDHVLVLDYKDEYRGLVKAGLARWWIGGPREAGWSSSTWHDFIAAQRKLVVARHDRMGKQEWQNLCSTAIRAARRLGDVLVIVDEAHFVAPQKGKVPAPIEGLATTGRGEGASSIWITQRPAKAEETVVSQCQARLLGGFESDADLSKISGVVEYPEDLHNPQVRAEIADVPSVLEPEDRQTPVSVQKHEDDQGNTVGSEWVYSDNSGERERRNTAGVAAEMASTHYGRQGKGIKV
jgi:hypothetical protein